MSPIESTIFMSKLIKEKEEEREAEEKITQIIRMSLSFS